MDQPQAGDGQQQTTVLGPGGVAVVGGIVGGGGGGVGGVVHQQRRTVGVHVFRDGGFRRWVQRRFHQLFGLGKDIVFAGRTGVVVGRLAGLLVVVIVVVVVVVVGGGGGAASNDFLVHDTVAVNVDEHTDSPRVFGAMVGGTGMEVL
jgi:hypothetical protein